MEGQAPACPQGGVAEVVGDSWARWNLPLQMAFAINEVRRKSLVILVLGFCSVDLVMAEPVKFSWVKKTLIEDEGAGHNKEGRLSRIPVGHAFFLLAGSVLEIETFAN